MTRTLTLKNRFQGNTTIVENDFIDNYLAKANGEYVKVYLVLLRHLNGNTGGLSICGLADCLECTEKDILRAFKYWSKVGLLNIDYDEAGNMTGINQAIAGNGTGCSVINRSPNKDGAWQFLCWWTSADTQLRYNNNVESILGVVSRTATANVEAFSSYSWNADDLQILLNQWSKVEELPEVPGGYYVSRAVDQAYWAVLNNESNEKDAMLEWGEVADNEIARKIAEYTKN